MNRTFVSDTARRLNAAAAELAPRLEMAQIYELAACQSLIRDLTT